MVIIWPRPRPRVDRELRQILGRDALPPRREGGITRTRKSKRGKPLANIKALQAEIKALLAEIGFRLHGRRRSKVGLSPNLPLRGMGQRSLDLIEAMHPIIAAAQPITGRGVGYKLFVRG